MKKNFIDPEYDVQPEDAVQFVRSAILGSQSGPVPPGYKNLPPEQRAKFHALPSRFNCLVPLKDNQVLACNTFYGSFAKWGNKDLDVYQSLSKGTVPLDDPIALEFLTGGFAVSSSDNEMQRLEKYYRSVRFNPGVMNLTLVPTLNCNFACDYCFQGQGKPKGMMQPEVVEAVSPQLEQAAPTLNRLQVCWYGGETTLAAGSFIEPLSDRLMDLCKEKKIAYNAFMVTNGFLYTKEMASRLLKKRINTVQVTLDGPPEYHDTRRCLLAGGPTYEKIVGNLIEITNTLPVTIMIRVNIDERNKDKVRALADDLAVRGLGRKPKFRVYFAPVRASTEGCHSCSEITMLNAAYGRLEADLYRYTIEKGLSSLPQPPMLLGNCQAVRPKGMIVLPNGDLHKCWDTVGSNTLRTGTIFDLDNFYKGDAHQKWMQWTPFKEDACKACNILPSCVGFCAYKHLFGNLARGEMATVPCPSWKFNINERLFLRAEKKGVVTRDLWDETHSPTVRSGS